MTPDVFHERLRASGISLWELGDLLGIHPHQLHDVHPDELADRPVRVVMELARRLDLHPADLVPALDAVLGNQRAPDPACSDDIRAAESVRSGDAEMVLTALAAVHPQPLSVDHLADALGWILPRLHHALAYLMDHPELGGPMRLRRVPPERLALTPRLDLLTVEQRQTVCDGARASTGLTDDEAAVLLAALACGHTPDYAAFRTRPGWHEAETTLKTGGLLYSDNGPHRAFATADVHYSLRYHGDHEHPPPRPDTATVPEDEPWP
ncbi:hypothetical protein ACU635_59530 [[Actinomadura] parvosata]|uniref:hypothetical protein n=1 Tax=[Actinomadura] parvosata TaxID=1955412 RepID=UPI00406C87D6